VASAGLVYRARLGGLLVCEDGDEGHYPLGLELLEHVRRHNGLGHAAGGDGRDDVAENVVLETLFCERLGETDEGEFGGCRGLAMARLSTHEMLTRVVGLPKRPKQTSSRRRANQTSVLLLPKVGPRGMRALVCSLDVDLVDEIPVLLLHVLEADIAQDAGIVDEHIDAPEVVDGRLDDGLSVLDRIVVGDGLAACSADRVDDLVCGLRGESVAKFTRPDSNEAVDDIPGSPGPRP